MSIDIDINEMFSEKNQKIFLNKLIMDLENNTDTFKLVTKHIIMIEVAKLLSSLKRVYDKYSVSYDENKIKELLSSTKNNLIEDINIVIDDKTSKNSSYVGEGRNRSINKTYLRGYHKQIDESESDFEDSLSLTVKEDAEIGLYNSLINLYPCTNLEMHHDIIKIINIDFSHTIISRVTAESKHRNMTLKNISEETYQKYLELSRSSDNFNKRPKRKIKTEN